MTHVAVRMVRCCIAALLAALPLVHPLAVATTSPGAPVAAPALPGLHILAQDADHMQIELVAPRELLEIQNVHIQSVQQDPKAGCDAVQMAGYERGGEAGQPWLPVMSALIGTPAQAEVVVHVLEQETTAIAGDYNVCPVPTAAASRDGLSRVPQRGLPAQPNLVAVRDEGVYAADRWQPAQAVDIVPAGRLRDQHVARLSFHPVQYNPASGQIQLTTRLRAEVRFVQPGDGKVTRPTPLSRDPQRDPWPTRQPALEGGSPGGRLSRLSRVVQRGVPQREARPESPAFETLLGATILNYAQAQSWRAAPAPDDAAPQIAAAAPRYKLLVRRDGIQRLDSAALQGAGLDPAAVDPRAIRIFSGQQEIAIRVSGEEDGAFDAGDAIEFYGQALNSKHTDTNVYWLAVGDQAGLRMARVDGHPVESVALAAHYSATIHLQENTVYWPAPSPSGGIDYWYWQRLASGDPVSALNAPLIAPAVASGDLTATLRMAVKSRWDDTAVNPDHHLRILFNGRVLRDLWWDGERPIVSETALPQSSITALTNTIRLVTPGDTGAVFDGVYVDWLELDYRRAYRAVNDTLHLASPGPGVWRYQVDGFGQPGAGVYDVTDPLQPAQVISLTTTATGDGYAVSFQDAAPGPRAYVALTPAQMPAPEISRAEDSSWLRRSTNGADYIAITHPDFVTATTVLAGYRQAQGLRSVVVTTEDIYNEFSDGVFDPEAIRAFLAYAYANWQAPAPSYVLLVGDGSVDFRDYLGAGEPNIVPPMLAQVDPSLGETMSDNRYVTISGDDPLPDMIIGRLPAATPAEAAMMIEKTMRYERESSGSGAPQTVLFAADNADSAGDFAAMSDYMATLLPAEYTAERIYYGLTHSPIATARQAIIGALGRGPLFANYLGHAAVQFWAAERLLRIEDIGALAATDTPPILLAWSCYEGWFAYPGTPSLDESLMRAAQGGVVASWSPTGLSAALGHIELAQRFYDAVFIDGSARFGQATTLAKLRLYAEVPLGHDLIDTYLVFGDPALRLPIARAQFTLHLPVVIGNW